MASELRVLHYLNQFFGQIGGEEKANIEVSVVEGPLGPGRAVNNVLKGRGSVVATIICGDNSFVEKQEEISRRVLEIAESYHPDLFLAGPAFNAGRYGVACGALCKAIQEGLKIPAVTGMFEENPGVDLYRKEVYIIKTPNSAGAMLEAIQKMVGLGTKLLSGQEIGTPEEEGYFARGVLRNVLFGRSGAERALDMLLAKLKGEPYKTEVPLPKYNRVSPSAPIPDLTSATIALVTDGGLVPKGNPDKIESLAATKFGIYPIENLEDLRGMACEVNHVGYDSRYVSEDPNRLVPLDVMRSLEKEGVIGKLHENFLATTGVATSFMNCQQIGREMAKYLQSQQVSGVLLSST